MKQERGISMYKIVRKKELNPTVTLMEIEAPLVARKAKAGQFIIFRAKEDSERIPLTIAGYDRQKGTVDIIFQIVGAGTEILNSLNEGEYIQDFVGPLGRPTEIEGLKKVAVVGGGNTALEDAVYLSNLAKKVYVIHRRDEFRADESIVDKLKEKENVKFVYNSNVTKLNSNEKLESIEVTDKEGNIKTIEVSGIFIAVGRIPENENFSKIINLDEQGYIIAKEDCHTNVPGIFTSGDNRTKDLRQLVTATSDGAMAATEAVKYINNK